MTPGFSNNPCPRIRPYAYTWYMRARERDPEPLSADDLYLTATFEKNFSILPLFTVNLGTRYTMADSKMWRGLKPNKAKKVFERHPDLLEPDSIKEFSKS